MDIKKILKTTMWSLLTIALLVAGILAAVNVDWVWTNSLKEGSNYLKVSQVEAIGLNLAFVIVFWFGFVAAAIMTTISILDLVKSNKSAKIESKKEQ